MALNRLMILKESIAVFLNENNEGEILKEFQNSYKDLVFLSDIFEKYNIFNKQLQKKKLTIIETKMKIQSFYQKYKLLKTRVEGGNFDNFERTNEIKTEIKIEDINKWSSYMSSVIVDLSTRFKEIFDLEIPEWVINPFETDISLISENTQEEIIDMRNEFDLLDMFNKKGYIEF